MQQGFANWAGESFSAWGRDEFSAPHRKYIVAKVGSQTANRRAHGRLAQVDSARSRGEVALRHQSVERHEKVQIKPFETHRGKYPIRGCLP